MSKTHRSPSDKKRYTDPDFIWYFDVDPVDLSYIMMKKSKGFHVTSEESDRFGKYVIGMIGQVLVRPVRQVCDRYDRSSTSQASLHQKAVLAERTHHRVRYSLCPSEVEQDLCSSGQSLRIPSQSMRVRMRYEPTKGLKSVQQSETNRRASQRLLRQL